MLPVTRAVSGIDTDVTVLAVTVNGVENESPGMATVPDVFVSPVMNSVSVSMLRLFVNISQKSVPLLSWLPAACAGRCVSRNVNISTSATAVPTSSRVHWNRDRMNHPPKGELEMH